MPGVCPILTSPTHSELARPSARSSHEKSRMRNYLLSMRPAACALVAGLVVQSSHGKDLRVYRFFPVNQYGLELTASYRNPIIECVSQKSGVKLQLKIGRTSTDTTAYVLGHEVEFVFTNHLFSPDRDNLRWKVFGRRNAPPILSQIVVRPNSPVQSLEKLADRTVAFPGPEALVAYKIAYAHLLSRKISVQVVFGGNMDAAFSQLTSGKAIAAGTTSQLANGWSSREKKTPARVVAIRAVSRFGAHGRSRLFRPKT